MAASPLVVTCLLDDASVREVLADADLGGRDLVDLTTSTPAESRSRAAWASGRGARFLDGGIMAVPPMVGVPEAGGYVFYSGSREVFDAHREVLAVPAATRYVGADPGLAALQDVALLSAMTAMFAGARHAAALVAEAGIDQKAFGALVAEWLTAMAPSTAAYAGGPAPRTPRARPWRRPGTAALLRTGRRPGGPRPRPGTTGAIPAHPAKRRRKLADMQVIQSTKLANVCYEIRGPALEEAMRLEAAGQRILKLNTGNPAAFGFECPPEILEDILRNVAGAHGYGDAKGLLSARRAVMQHYQTKGIDLDVEDVYLGNGVSELIQMSMQALLNDGDEVLVPAPDYPLWTASVSLAGGTAVHYRCDEQADWMPDLADIERKITDRTKALVIINPNNPTGAVYDDEMLRGLTEIARRHNLIVCSDEIYDRILYDGATHTPTAALAPDLMVLTFNGLSKNYRVAGYRSGWMAVCGPGARLLVHRGADDPRQHAALRQHAVAARGGHRARRAAVDRGPGAARRPDPGAAGHGVRAADLDPRGDLCEAEGGAVPLPPARPGGLQDQGRPADGAGPAARREDHGRAGHRLQLAGTRSLPDRHAADGRGSDRRRDQDRKLPGRVRAAVATGRFPATPPAHRRSPPAIRADPVPDDTQL
ncbi:Histidinol-phosphate aminotransferase [Streptomyces californicus]